MDEAFAWYLYQHVQDGYQFLMENYNVGDRVLLFGAFEAFPKTESDLPRYRRLFSWCIYRPGSRRDVAQGGI